MSQKFEMTGKILSINETQTFASGFQKREFVLETADEKYPQQIKFEVVKAYCAQLDSYEIGDPATVHFNVRGNEYGGKHYVSLQCWKLDREGQRQAAPPQSRPVQKSMPPAPAAEDDWSEKDPDDDIPF